MTSHWRLDVKPRHLHKGYEWQLIHAHGLEPNGAPWMVADHGKADSREAAEAAAHAAWARISTAEVPGVPVDWSGTGVEPVLRDESSVHPYTKPDH